MLLASLLAAALAPTQLRAQAPESALSQSDEGKLVEAMRGEPRKSMKVRLQAAIILGRSGTSSAVPALIDCLSQDPDEPVRSACALALGNIGDARAVEPLASQLDDVGRLLREESRRALLKLARLEALPYLQAACEHGSVRVRQVIAEVAALIKDSQAGALLAELLGDPEDRVREKAEATLASMEPGAAGVFLLRGLDHSNYRVRAQCAKELGRRKNVQAIDRLVEILGSPLEAVEVQAAARQALRQMKSALDSRKLSAQARDRAAEKKDRVRALTLISAVGGSNALLVGLDVLGDADVSMRSSASQALADLGDPRALPALREALAKPENERISKAIATAIHRLESGPAL
jgi:HEAT repeat protein